MNKKLLTLVDGNSFMHRAFHSVTYLSNIENQPTNAITGFLKMINGIIEYNNPEKLIFVFDAKGKTFRHELFDGYKGDRPKTDPSLKQQFPVIKEIIKHWGYPIVEVEGVEADDTLMTLAKKGEAEGYTVHIATSDKDMYQGVNENIHILDTKSADKSSDAKPLGIDGTIKKFGVKPEQIVDYLALLGDKADSIPGVEGCGEKTAVSLLNEHGTIEEIIKNADEIKGKAGKSLRNGFDYDFSRQLICLKTDVNTGELSDLVGQRDNVELFKIASKYELRDFINTQQLVNPAPNLNPLTINSNLDDLIESTSVSSSVKHLIEVDVDSPFGLLLITDLVSNTSYFISKTDMDYCSFTTRYITALNSAENKEILTPDSKELIKSLGSEGLIISFPTFKDYRIYHYNRFGRDSQSLNFDYINFWSSNIKLSDNRKLFKLDTKNPVFKGMDLKDYLDIKLEEHYVLSKAIDKLQPKGIFSEEPIALDHAYMHVLSHKELSGVGLDSAKLDIALDRLLEQKSELDAKIEQELGYPLKTSSPKEVKSALFDKLEIPIKKQSTNAKDLEPLVNDYPIVGWIIEVRSIEHLINTYAKGFKKRIAKDGRIYAKYLATKTASSRVSCIDPNLTAIPNSSKSGNGTLIRSAFVAQQHDGCEPRVILSVDCSQAELRVLAGLSKCEPLIEAFNNGVDIHAMTGSLISDDYSNTDLERRRAKAVNFGLIYGLSPSSLSQDLEISLNEAKEIISVVNDRIGDVANYQKDLIEKVKKEKYYTTVTGRVFPFGNVSASNSMVSSEAQRSLKSVSNQAVVSDIIKKASVEIFNNHMSKPENSDIIMMMQIHDELVFELPLSKSDSFSEIVKDALKNAMPLDVAMKCDHKIDVVLQ